MSHISKSLVERLQFFVNDENTSFEDAAEQLCEEFDAEEIVVFLLTLLDKGKKMCLPKFDKTPLKSDFNDLDSLIVDMTSFIENHKDWITYPADDPGFHHEPPRVPRKGWVAYNPDNENETKEWTITLSKARGGKLPLPQILLAKGSPPGS
jgi:hypothetical protein